MQEKDRAAGMLPPLFGDESDSKKRLAAWMADRLMRHMMRINQFAAMTADEKERLLRIYADYLDTIGETILAAKDREGLAFSLRSLVVRHFYTLRSFFQGIRDAKLFDRLRHSPVLLHIPCFEYTPELQIELLGIDVNKLRTPVLDIGCGMSGRLVRRLRQQGFEAYGLDAFAPDGRGFFRAGWLEFSFQPNKWGTVVSHMAFSNHFQHHHERIDGLPERYAAKYMEILRSITAEGSFYYAPGLPFIESLLPADRYEIRTKRLQDHETGRWLPDERRYAARVTKLG